MGWLFGHYDRKSLVEHLTTGNGVETLKRCFRGNDMWAVQRTKDGVVFACLYMLRGNPRVTDDPCNWGYKDVDETMGPGRLDFPVSWLDLLSPIESEYAVAWRKSVRERGEKLQSAKIGSKWKGYGHDFEITARRSPSSFRARDETGMGWQLTSKNIVSMERQT